MNKKDVIAILALFGVGVVAAAAIQNYQQTITIQNAEYMVYFDSVYMPINGTFNWGTLKSGSVYEHNFTVQNLNNVSAITVVFNVWNLPEGFTQTWILNNTVVPASSSISAPLTLTIPSTTPEGTYTWPYSITTT